MEFRPFFRRVLVGLLLAFLLCLPACTAPPVPPEVQQAEEQEHRLWVSGAEVHAPGDFIRYRAAFRRAKEELIRERARMAWFQDFQAVQSQFRDVLKTGDALQEEVARRKGAKKEALSGRLSELRSRIDALKALTEKINEGRLARKDLVRAELLLSEAAGRGEREDFAGAEKRLREVSRLTEAAEDAILPIFSRYADRAHIDQWRKMAAETVAESKRREAHAILVDKSRRLLLLYKNGVLLKTYPVGLGRNGSLDKRHAGDNSTPEGKYRVTKKISASRYHKALLINYPNEDDRRDFVRAKKRGLLPAGASIGGLIEIHGGGQDSMTYGCIAMDNPAIDSLFGLVDVGTPVTIVGAVEYRNSLSSAIEGS